ncbi:hypothetical protein CAEBREN_04466 [Caenorhabditis brenneri]|uniref:Uncharacterized protein n=1 Tax=Caenorhabditis brenneri TaxID=135651 RepID=G0P1X1_CAEBE|nr:hypothetical protein CAEBREN_04466 [Caenorhabditis brenneri]
MRGNYYGLDI